MKKISKKLITSMIFCAMSFAVAFSYANTKVANVVDFSFKFNDRDVKLEDTNTVVIDGRTYLPLAALCEQLLGMTVDWVPETTTVEIWNITKPSDRGSHEFPVPVGIPVTGEFYNKNDKQYIPYNVSVTEVIRGHQAEEWLRREYMEFNEYPQMEKVVKKSGEKNSQYKKRVENAELAYEKAVKNYEAKYDKYIEELKQDETKEFLRAKIRIDIVQANSDFCYSTNLKDLVPYCGNVNVDGLQRQFVQYSVKTPKIRDEVNYSGHDILTNGTYEGYYVVPVYKSDYTPRIMYKDGQYLALY